MSPTETLPSRLSAMALTLPNTSSMAWFCCAMPILPVARGQCGGPLARSPPRRGSLPATAGRRPLAFGGAAWDRHRGDRQGPAAIQRWRGAWGSCGRRLSVRADGTPDAGTPHDRQWIPRRVRFTSASKGLRGRAMAFGEGHHLHLIDGSAFIFRAYHALPPLTRRSDGLPVGAVAGFCNMLFRYIESATGDEAPTHAAVIFDKGSVTFRNGIYDRYKANREEMPEDLRPQIPLTREATRAFNVACEEVEGFEADDIIATLARQAREAGGRVTIISGDKDLLQLVGPQVTMIRPGMQGKPDERVGPEGVVRWFGVPPELMIDLQAIAGDTIDNIPGVK